ncbi:MAG TPA: endonuclease/exonuclease/phosphatase family protein [Pyrinomonadaceae bacterium]|nr:endonuclease/exonuclease/phosphatase family protein [Pyrinomonadaceae bacterium]
MYYLALRMNTFAPQETPAAPPLEHGLGPHFPALAQFDSTQALESSPLYARLRPEVERVLGGVAVEEFGSRVRPEASNVLRATAWNVERGARLEGIAGMLRSHPVLSGSDVLLLTELDYGMARSGNRFVARELARLLGMSYAFAPCYLNLTKGNGAEADAEGENGLALHGNAVLSRWPLRAARSVALPNGKDKMRGAEKRLGSQRAVVCRIEHPAGAFRAVSLHLDAHSSQRHRRRQMEVVLDFVESLRPRLPVLVGGDWNTSTYNSSRAVYSIAGFARRVMMGVGNVIENHYLRPENWFERGLFRALERRGYRFRELNEPGRGTLHYDVKDLAANTNMADWVPRWCFWWIEWALRDHGGRCSLKLDWFAGRGVEPDTSSPPRVVGDLRGPSGEVLSDHDPIVLDFVARP